MKILVIDRDRESCDHLQTILSGMGAEIVFEPTKNTAIELMRTQSFDAVLFDPAPQNEYRSFIMGVRRSLNSFPPILILSQTLTLADVLPAGANEIIKKPFDEAEVKKKLVDAARITSVAATMANEAEDFPSKDGIIAKSAFNQLFITCLDRADRHGEKSFLIFIAVENFDDIVKNDGQEEADKVSNALRKMISRTRRTSDIAGHIKPSEFCILLLRIVKNDEPLLAATRFAEAIKSNLDLIATSKTKAVLKTWLLAAPSGEILVEHTAKGA
jgi:PleD family two-component response regulator